MDAKNKISQVFFEDVLLSVKGQFLIANGLKEEWAKIRGINPEIIDNDFEDHITLYQKEMLDVLVFCKSLANRKHKIK